MDDCRAADDYCDQCEMDSYILIDRLVKDIQRLEAKVVYLRYSLSRYLRKHEGEMLRCEILSDLSGSYYDQPAYQRFVSDYCGGLDPMDCDKYIVYLTNLSIGDAAADY